MADNARVPMVLGTMHFGTRTPEKESFELLDRFVEAGGTMIDTADCYAFWRSESGFGGQSETVIGRWLERYPQGRERLFISTKVGAEPTVAGGFPQHREGLSPEVISSAVRQSLERMRIDRIELYWAHMEDRSVPVEDTVQAFGDLVEQGVVDRVGSSNHPIWWVERARALAAARGLAGYTALQHSYSYLQPRPGAPVPGKDHRFGMVTDEMIDYVDTNPGMWLWAYSPLLEGAYAKPERLPEAYQHPGTERRLAVLDEVAAELGATRNQVVLAWLVGGKPSITPLVGVSSVDQLDEAMAGVRLELAPEQRTRLDTAT